MSIRFRTTAVPLMILLLQAACAHQAPTNNDTSRVLARVNGEAITEQRYEYYAQQRKKQKLTSQDAKDDRKTILDEMISRVVLAQQAVDNHAARERDADPATALHNEIELARATLLKHLTVDQPITDKDLQERYEQELRNADKNEYRARHILVRQEAQAKAIIADLKKGGNFGDLAQKNSIDVRSGKQDGDLGWFSRETMVPEVYNAAASLKKGKISLAPVKSEFGWHVIKLEDSRPRKLPTFDEAKGYVQRSLQMESINKLIIALKEKAKVEFYDQ